MSPGPDPRDRPLAAGRSGAETTMVKRVLERRAERHAETDEGTTATVAVMLRVLPTPEAWLVFENPRLVAELEPRIVPGVLEGLTLSPREAREKLAQDYRPVVFTDDLELIRQLRGADPARPPFIVYVSELDGSRERTLGLEAGADECIGRRASEREFQARIGIARRVAELESVLRITLDENRKLSAIDDLTRVGSRRFFAKQFPREVERAARYGRALSLILCDIDNFKHINDTHGHAGGDDILRQIGPRLQRLLRAKIDWVARLGGEEFAVVLPEVAFTGALEVARKLRALIAQNPFNVQGRRLAVSASFGVCGFDRVPGQERALPERMLKIADAALYRSKRDGRDRVTGVNGLGDAPAGRP